MSILASTYWTSAALLLVLTAPGTVRSAWAQEDPVSNTTDKVAREHFLRGERYYEEGAYEIAIVEFQKAFDLSGRPQLLFNLANCHERLSSYELAIEALRRYLKTVPEIERDALVRRIRNLEKRADEKAERTIPLQPTGSTVAAKPTDNSPDNVELKLSTTTANKQSSTSTLGWVLIGTGVALGAGGVASGFVVIRPPYDVHSKLDYAAA